MDKGDVASGRDRDAHRVCAETRIAAGRRVESPAVGRGMGSRTSTVMHRRGTVPRLKSFEPILTSSNSKFHIGT